MPNQIKLFTIDATHKTVESVEKATNEWLAANDGKIVLHVVIQDAVYMHDGTIGISIMVGYSTTEQTPPSPPKPS